MNDRQKAGEQWDGMVGLINDVNKEYMKYDKDRIRSEKNQYRFLQLPTSPLIILKDKN